MNTSNRLGLLAVTASAALGAGALFWQKHERRARGLLLRPDNDSLVDAARTLNRGANLLALAVVSDSAVEHYRGDFRNRAMYTPLLVSTLQLLAGLHGVRDRLPRAHRLRDGIAASAIASGVAGTALHLYNVGKRPGGLNWSNLFYAAPLGAPSALLLSGVLGLYGERLRGASDEIQPQVFGLPAGRAVALMVSAGLLGTAAEAALLHFRGSFQNPSMYLPVTAAPCTAALLAACAASRYDRPRLRWWSRLGLRFTTLMGLVGSAFHGLGVARNHGGWRNWRQNLQVGPPLPAPSGFTGLSLAGLAAHTLIERHRELADPQGKPR
ncbi:hypothetical protein ACSVIJ_12095 [Pseudomonas sp. NCHU5208]|uniref:hypothetical protein n=1 Tax=unclassified Pseudomonas TaxID=196821 RepID=UPI003F9E74DC